MRSVQNTGSISEIDWLELVKKIIWQKAKTDNDFHRKGVETIDHNNLINVGDKNSLFTVIRQHCYGFGIKIRIYNHCWTVLVYFTFYFFNTSLCFYSSAVLYLPSSAPTDKFNWNWALYRTNSTTHPPTPTPMESN